MQIYDTSLTFRPLVELAAGYGTSANTLTMNLKGKMIQDEMGEAFELEYGRMSGFLGVETPNAQAGLQNMILHGYTYPPDEILDGIELPPGVEVKAYRCHRRRHADLEVHPQTAWIPTRSIFHLYDVQLLNRVGWDGIVRKPDPTEFGWKDTVRVSPLEDTIVAMRPIIPELPPEWGGLPNSIRLLDPSMPEGMYLEAANTTQREAAGLPIWGLQPGRRASRHHQPLRQFRLGICLPLPHPQPRRDGYDARPGCGGCSGCTDRYRLGQNREWSQPSV